MQELDQRKARLFAADCAEHVIYIYEETYPEHKDLVREGIQAARDFANSFPDDPEHPYDLSHDEMDIINEKITALYTPTSGRDLVDIYALRAIMSCTCSSYINIYAIKSLMCDAEHVVSKNSRSRYERNDIERQWQIERFAAYFGMKIKQAEKFLDNAY